MIYRLKLPKMKDFIFIISNKQIDAKGFLCYDGIIYYVKRVYFPNNRETGYLVEVENTKEKPKEFVTVRKWTR